MILFRSAILRNRIQSTLRVGRLALCAIALSPFAVPTQALANDYPVKAVRVVVPWPPGGIVDVVARVLGEKLNVELGQPFVIENRAGAAGNIGAELVAKAEPDGYVVLLTNSSLTMGAAISSNLPFDMNRAFEPIVLTGFAPSILVVHPSLGVKSVAELVSLAKSRPGRLTYASSGNGTPAHFAAEMFRTIAAIDVVHVPYKGAGPMMNDQIAGHVNFSFSVAPAALQQIKAGRVLPLAITSAKRSALISDIPTMQEAGIAGYEASQWVGYLAPRGTPKSVIERFSSAVNKLLASDEVRESLARQGIDPDGSSTPASFAAFVQKDLAKWKAVVRDAKIQVQ